MSQDDRFPTVDPEALAKHFDAPAAEAKWDRVWDESGVYRYDERQPREETFVVDTPPPTVSGSLHVGHVFSYTHTDVIVRQRRMSGQNIYYPMGWDDNGLPTERRVQNYFHVRCDPSLPYEPGLTLPPATEKQIKDQPPKIVSRRNFIELCQVVTREDEQAFLQMWRRVGLSVDWTEEYATIDDRCRHLAQLSFLDLHHKGHIYNVDAPTMWDVDYQTAVAQAEVVDKPKRGAFHEIRFGVADAPDRSFVIATTRPELLAACVGVTAHPEDERYRDLFGKRAVTPVFHAEVPIFPSELADPKKGTGILMVCTFGDQTDVQWWREQMLAMRQIIDRDGRLRPITFGTDAFPSRDPERANKAYAEIAGKRVNGARTKMVELLRDGSNAASGGDAPLIGEPKPTEQAVKHYEKGDQPLEFISTRQWFVGLLEHKEALLQRGAEIQWHPDFMHQRYKNWTENLGLDWCISRQRYFGVPIPVWYPLDGNGAPQYERPIVASQGRLPCDPMSDVPPGYTEAQRGKPGGFVGDPDVFDTWFTSSLTPQIGSRWWLDLERHSKIFPADIRPQSHEIIRTWAFYTIAKAHLHDDTIPWKHVVISGWIVDRDRKKMSKSVGNVVTPMHLLDEYTADGVRYWAASARLGMDTAFDEKQFKVGKKLVTKIFNAGKFVLAQGAERHPITAELDRAFVAKLGQLVTEASAAFEEFEFAKALMLTEQFFWTSFTDTFIELSKTRARGDDGDRAAQGSAVAALRLGLNVLLRLFAPSLPYITEEVWSWVFAAEHGEPSIHRAPWPTVQELAAVEKPIDPTSFDLAVEAFAVINKAKADAGVSVGRVTEHLVLAANPPTIERLRRVWTDVSGAARCTRHELREDASLADGALVVVEAKFAEKVEKAG